MTSLRRQDGSGDREVGDQAVFSELMREVMRGAEHFGHRQHIHLTWLAVRRLGTTRAVALVSDGNQGTAGYAGAPQKYHVTVSRAWVELVGHHTGHDAIDGFDSFADQHPSLMDKRLLTRFYLATTLASSAARTGWVEPDLAPFFPWRRCAPLISVGTGLLLTGRGMHRLGRCSVTDCVQVYADTSRSGRQRYCSTTCANRAAVRRHRVRVAAVNS